MHARPPQPRRRHLAPGLALGLGLALLAGAALADTPKPKPRPDATTAQPMPDSPAGIYLAARFALTQNDFAAATDLYARALALDPANPALLDGAVTVRLATGDLPGASEAARVLLAQGAKSQAAVLAILAADIQSKDFAAIPNDLAGDHSIGEMTDALILAWAQLGQGSMTDALAAFDKLSSTTGMQGFALYHKALAMALSGDFEGADKILSGPDLGQIANTRRAIVARVQVLAQLDRRPAALAVLDQTFPAGQDASMDALRAKLKGTDPIAFDVVTSPRDGMTEVLFDMGAALSGQADDGYVLLFTRTAAALRPDNVEATMLSAQILQRLGQSALAADVYALIPPANPAFLDAEIGRAAAAMQAGNGDEAVATLTKLQQSHPNDPSVVQSLADTLRRLGRFADAAAQYDTAITLVGSPKPGDWPLFYARAICLSEIKHWPDAERDFRKALELNPNQPQVLNYLGYSYVDRGENLDEALKMIQRAVILAPDQGYIVDSLAWALYRLGRFQDAVVPMERASLLLPVDAVVTDHLGDVYWSVDRKMEARFQWRRALSFHPTEQDATRIQRKLDVGLDQVLQDEKAAKAATDTPPATPGPSTPAPADAASPAPATPAPSSSGNGG